MRSRNGIPGEGAGAKARIGRSFPLAKYFRVAYVAVLGALVGWQIYDPSKRFIEAVAGLILIGVVWNFSAIQAVWLIIIAYPFPFGFSGGNSTFVFTLVVFVIYMVHVSTGKYRFHGDKLLNAPIAVIVMAYIISFYNQPTEPYIFKFAIFNTINFFVIVLLYYMLINLIDSEKHLRQTMAVFMVSTALVTAFSFLELLFPGKVILPNLIYSTAKVTLAMKDIRVRGPLHDYELLAQFFALNVPVLILMVVRSGRLLVRLIYLSLLVLVLFMQFATITRGAFISLLIGVAYMAWICRKDLNIVLFVGLAAAFVGALVVIDTVMSRYTFSGSLFARLLQTNIERGFIPETRVASWTGAVERWLKHPFIGNGPGWDFSKGLEGELWPHSSYLHYLNIFGIFGTSAFLFLVYRLFKASVKEMRVSLVTSSFPEALMKALHVMLVIFIVDMVKVDYQRNYIYMYFVWIFFALISATRALIDRTNKAAAEAAAEPAAPA